MFNHKNPLKLGFLQFSLGTFKALVNKFMGKLVIKNYPYVNWFDLSKGIYLKFPSLKLDPCSLVGAVWVAVEGPYSSRGGPVR